MTGAPFGSDRWPTVVALELFRVAIPLLRPHVYAGGEERDRNVVLVRALADDGAEGWGECSTLSKAGYSFETTEIAWHALRDELAPEWLAGRQPTTALPMAHAALETAAIDIDLRRRDVSAVDALAKVFGTPRTGIEWCAVLGLEPTLDEVELAALAGAAQLKIKIAPRRDVDPIRMVRDAYPEFPIAADANGSYPTHSAVPSELSDLGLAYLEQPVAPEDLRGSARVAHRLGVPIALDESIRSRATLLEAIEVGAGSVLNVKPARLGGLVETSRVLLEARDADLGVFVGGMLETGVGRAVALAVAAQAPCTLPADVGPTSRYFAPDVTAAFEPDGEGRLHPPTQAGVGLVPDPAALERFTVDRVSLRS